VALEDTMAGVLPVGATAWTIPIHKIFDAGRRRGISQDSEARLYLLDSIRLIDLLWWSFHPPRIEPASVGRGQIRILRVGTEREEGTGVSLSR